MSQIPTVQWNYFLSLERDFIRTLDVVELDQANARAFGNEYAKLLLLIGSETDVVAKMLIAQSNPQASANNMHDYQAALTAAFQGIDTVAVDVPRYQRTIQPWQSWGTGPNSPPSWWSAYNKVKHERDTHFKLANQDNALTSLCGLLSLLLYLYHSQDVPEPYPQLLNCGFPGGLRMEGGPQLPGVT